MIHPIPFLLFMVTALAIGLTHPSTNEALARCENRPGATIAECRLTVLGR